MTSAHAGATRFGDLSPSEIEALLREQFVARIACQAPNRPYIVPVSYAYDGTYVYGYSGDGLKLQLMLEHPRVCVEVDEVHSITDWRSVIAYGQFEALFDAQAYAALELLAARQRLPLGADCANGPVATYVTRRSGYGVVYRIRLEEKTGRYEQRYLEA